MLTVRVGVRDDPVIWTPFAHTHTKLILVHVHPTHATTFEHRNAGLVRRTPYRTFITGRRRANGQVGRVRAHGTGELRRTLSGTRRAKVARNRATLAASGGDVRPGSAGGTTGPRCSHAIFQHAVVGATLAHGTIGHFASREFTRVGV